MQSSLFQPGRQVIFTSFTSECVDATMKGPSEKGELFAVLEYMKGGQVVTHPEPKPAPKPRAKASSKASSTGKHVQLFCMVYDRKKSFQAEHL